VGTKAKDLGRGEDIALEGFREVPTGVLVKVQIRSLAYDHDLTSANQEKKFYSIGVSKGKELSSHQADDRRGGNQRGINRTVLEKAPVFHK